MITIMREIKNSTLQLFTLFFLSSATPMYLNAQCSTKPNVVIIFCDDLGYGDLSVYGHPTIATPNLDQLAYEGQKWTNFYAAAPVCTPSRAALMTGRLPVRNGMASRNRRVLFPDSKGGLPPTEITLAKQLKTAGYHTGMIGKWHLGHLAEYTPLAHGFDYYFGIPYSNDMDRIENEFAGVNYYQLMKLISRKAENFNVPLIRDSVVVERPVNQHTLTKRYTEEAISFINTHKKEPFFLYLAHSMPHVPLFASKAFESTSLRGRYGDAVEEIDWSVGEIVNTLKENRIARNTLVIFTSDNGPWLIFDQEGGSAGLLRGGKGGTLEGAMRVPAVFWWPGKIRPRVERGIGSTLDIFPTLSELTRTDMPTDRRYDGHDLSPVLLHDAASPRNLIFYYRDEDVYAIRKDNFKIHFITQGDYDSDEDKIVHRTPLLYNINEDPSELVNVAADHPFLIEEFKELLEMHNRTLRPVVNQLER